jgi:hypothetical protein
LGDEILDSGQAVDTYLEDDLRGGGADKRRCDMDDGIDA